MLDGLNLILGLLVAVFVIGGLVWIIRRGVSSGVQEALRKSAPPPAKSVTPSRSFDPVPPDLDREIEKAMRK